MIYPANAIAQADQHYAQARDNLEALVCGYRETARLGRADPTLRDGTVMPTGCHVAFLADLLAVAIDRMARS